MATKARQLSWSGSLPEIIEALRALLEGQEWFKADVEDVGPWARHAREVLAGNLCIMEEGDPACGPYRLTVKAMSTEEDGDNWHEPLLQLEIRPGAWWINEVRAAIADPGVLEKMEPAAV